MIRHGQLLTAGADPVLRELLYNNGFINSKLILNDYCPLKAVIRPENLLLMNCKVA
jgi:hypothetical protein